MSTPVAVGMEVEPGDLDGRVHGSVSEGRCEVGGDLAAIRRVGHGVLLGGSDDRLVAGDAVALFLSALGPRS